MLIGFQRRGRCGERQRSIRVGRSKRQKTQFINQAEYLVNLLHGKSRPLRPVQRRVAPFSNYIVGSLTLSSIRLCATLHFAATKGSGVRKFMLTAIELIAVAALVLTIEPAVAQADPAPPPGNPIPAYHNWTNSDPIWETENSVGYFIGQIKPYTQPINFAWGFRLQPAVQQIIIGTVDCTGYSPDLPTYHYSDLAKPVTYTFHSTMPNLVGKGHTYRLRLACTFQVLTDTGLVPGRVDTAVDARIGNN